MYHSHSYQDAAFDFFITFLKNAIKGDDKYKELIKPVIQETHQLVKGEKNYYTIDRGNYPIITYLAESDPEFFESIDTENLHTGDYSRILDDINSKGEFTIA